jgi:hypothetical protein
MVIPMMVFLVGSELYGRRMMSKRRGIWAVRWPLSAALGWWKRTAGRYWRFAASTMNSRQENQFEIARGTDNSQPLQLNFALELVELKEFAKILNIGDHIRVFCDDGVLVAEKVSQTQFKVLYSETISERVH